MSYDIKLSEYAFLPNKAVPLDARSHFENFYEAYNLIINKFVTTVEQAESQENKIYYIGQIITTTDDGTWQVVRQSNYTLYKLDNGMIGWNNKQNIISSLQWRINTIDTIFKLQLYNHDLLITTISENSSGDFSNITSFSFVSCIAPFSGGGGSGGTLKINVSTPLSYNEDTNTISLDVDNNSALKLTDNKLTIGLDITNPIIINSNKDLKLNIDKNSPLIIVQDNENKPALSLSIDNDSPLKIITINNQLALTLPLDKNGGIKQNADKTLFVEGIHSTIEKDGSTDAIKVGNYIYQEI